jgi:hypothetical protein
VVKVAVGGAVVTVVPGGLEFAWIVCRVPPKIRPHAPTVKGMARHTSPSVRHGILFITTLLAGVGLRTPPIMERLGGDG